MELINNVSKTLKDDLSVEIKNGSKLSIAAACFSIYAFQELKNELTNIDELRFIFTSPTFVTEKAKKEKREFYIPRLNRERSLYGTEFEIKLRNELTQKAIAKECAEWIREKVTFKSNVSDKSIQGQMVVDNVGYTPIDGFTTVELGCEKGNSISTTIVKDESLAQTLLRDFKAIAQSIPYLCMLLVRTEGVIRFFTFDRKENEFDDSRSRVRDICSSQDIIPIKEDISDGILITKLRASIANATSAEELNIEWSKLLKDCGLVLDTFDVSIDEYHHLLDKKLRFERIIEQDNDYEDDSGETDIFESDIFDGPTLEPSRETEEDMFVSFCTANVRTLYEEACEKDDLTEEKWLRNYIVACNDYANQLLVKSVNSKIAKEIVGAFFNRVDEEREEMQDTFDIEEFKECIGEEFFEKGE